MPSTLPVVSMINTASVSSFISKENDAKEFAFQGGSYKGDSYIWKLLQLTYKILNWANQFYSGDESYDAALLYMRSLYGRWAMDAQAVIAGASQSILVQQSGAVAFTIGFVQIQFVVGVSGMNPGDTVYSFTDPDMIQIGIVVLADGLEVPRGLSDRFSHTNMFVVDGAIITFNQPVQAGQVIIIRYEKTIPI